MCQNGYFDGLTQKGFLPGIAGCIEHATMSHEAIRDARLHHRNICFAWLDLKNAFGSIKHMFIQTCLSRYHFPPSLSKLVFNYYENLIAKVSVSTSTLTKLFHYAIGVFQGCVFCRQFSLTFVFNLFLISSASHLKLRDGRTPSKVTLQSTVMYLLLPTTYRALLMASNPLPRTN